MNSRACASFFELVVEKTQYRRIRRSADRSGSRPGRLASAADSHPSVCRRQSAPRVALSEPALLCRVPRHGRPRTRHLCVLVCPSARAYGPHRSQIPGETATDSAAPRHDLRPAAGWSLWDAPMILNFNPEEFEQDLSGFRCLKTTFDKRLFALGADAYALSQSVAHGVSSAQIKGLLGTLTYNLNFTPVVDRRAQTAMIQGGVVKPVSEEDLVEFEVLRQSKRPASPKPLAGATDARSRTCRTGSRNARAQRPGTGVRTPAANTETHRRNLRHNPLKNSTMLLKPQPRKRQPRPAP